MSNSDADPKAVIYLTDYEDTIVEKVIKAVTDFCSDVHYNPETRQGVRNIKAILLLTGKSVQQICEDAKDIDTGKYKMLVAEEIVEHLRPICNKIQQQLLQRNELVYLLEMGAEKARETAVSTMAEVRQKIGLGAHTHMPLMQQACKAEEQDQGAMKALASVTAKKPKTEFKKMVGDIEVSVVPKQMLSVEKKQQIQVEIQTNVDMEQPLKLDVKPVVAATTAANNKTETTKTINETAFISETPGKMDASTTTPTMTPTMPGPGKETKINDKHQKLFV